ncbi:MAG: glycosyltransferase [Oscillospiraceae bacterium]|nr:glycosyltransferase [Oscillospiraceae bacterium]
MDKVSIIVPVYNGEAHLRRCTESILAQDYPGLELILVDDGSRDGSYGLMCSIAEKDRRVIAVHKENGGVSSARNRGLAEATGRYVQFADVDDWLPLDATKLLVREMEAGNADLVIGDFYRVVGDNVSRKGSIAGSGILSRQDYADEMMRSPADLYYGVLWNKLYRRDLIERHAVRMDETISYSEDMIFNLDYLLHADRIAVLKAPVYYYEYTKGSLVDQNLNLAATVRMKQSVIGCYSEFFKNTFSPADYQERLPAIYSYLLAVSRDSLSLPFLPGTKKLSSEAGDELVKDSLNGELETAYLESRMLVRYLDTLAKKHRRGRDEMTLLYLLWRLKRPCRVAELCAFPGLEKSNAVLALARLLAAGLVTQETAGGTARYSFHAPELEEELRQAEADFRTVSFEGLSEEELAVYRRCRETVCANIRRRLLAER